MCVGVLICLTLSGCSDYRIGTVPDSQVASDAVARGPSSARDAAVLFADLCLAHRATGFAGSLDRAETRRDLEVISPTGGRVKGKVVSFGVVPGKSCRVNFLTRESLTAIARAFDRVGASTSDPRFNITYTGDLAPGHRQYVADLEIAT